MKFLYTRPFEAHLRRKLWEICGVCYYEPLSEKADWVAENRSKQLAVPSTSSPLQLLGKSTRLTTYFLLVFFLLRDGTTQKTHHTQFPAADGWRKHKNCIGTMLSVKTAIRKQLNERLARKTLLRIHVFIGKSETAESFWMYKKTWDWDLRWGNW